MQYLDFLGSVHTSLQPRSYLEIGVRGGHSIALSKAASIGIDPAYELAAELGPQVTLHRTTSDDYFAGDAPLAGFDPASADLAFIDGMHLYEFVLRDFINVERHADWTSVIVFDDVLPRNPTEALRERETRAWTGDVWKIIPTLDRLRPDLVVLRVSTKPTGLLLVLGADPRSTVLSQHYEDLERRHVSSGEEPPQQIIKRTGAIAPEKVLAAPFWATLRDLRAQGLPREQGLPLLMKSLRQWAGSSLTSTQARTAHLPVPATARLRGAATRVARKLR